VRGFLGCSVLDDKMTRSPVVHNAAGTSFPNGCFTFKDHERWTSETSGEKTTTIRAELCTYDRHLVFSRLKTDWLSKLSLTKKDRLNARV
jgi:hypothetical protein